jgi:hypothetical protein
VLQCHCAHEPPCQFWQKLRGPVPESQGCQGCAFLIGGLVLHGNGDAMVINTHGAYHRIPTARLLTWNQPQIFPLSDRACE